MSFTEDLAPYSAPEIVQFLGCPRATAYQWKDGRRMPPEWQQAHWLRILATASKKHNKTVDSNRHER